MSDKLMHTPLNNLHKGSHARMTPFAGYDMPLQYKNGIMSEHLHTRSHAGLFDVSHMGQVVLRGNDFKQTAKALETLIPMEVETLKVDRQRYGFFTNSAGGISDDFMFSNRGDHIYMVVNASRKEDDIKYLRENLEPLGVSVRNLENRALIALQGPTSQKVLEEHFPKISKMRFMDVSTIPIAGAECWVSRSGYTGDDGFEISIPSQAAEIVTTSLLKHETVELAGLGARDSLRLEAGLCLYGQDIDATTSPVAAGLKWAMHNSRLRGGYKEGKFPGAEKILSEISDGTEYKLVGFVPLGKAPIRANTELFGHGSSSDKIGWITSGSFSPTLKHPIALGYVKKEYSIQGNRVNAQVRGKLLEVEVTQLPFVKKNFKK
jgi:aminomethyltransferase